MVDGSTVAQRSKYAARASREETLDGRVHEAAVGVAIRRGHRKGDDDGPATQDPRHGTSIAGRPPRTPTDFRTNLRQLRVLYNVC